MLYHSTSYPRILFAKGDLFSKESLSHFDGILAFAEGFTGINRVAYDAVNGGLIKCPFRIHGLDTFSIGKSTTSVYRNVQRDLDYLANQGCQRIGIHAPNQMDRAKSALRAAVKWLEDHADDVVTLTFVDLRDDYYNCFGLDSFDKEKGIRNPSPSPFESYYELGFQFDMERVFGPRGRAECCSCHFIEKVDAAETLGSTLFFPIYFSVGLFYTNLVPQAVAKVTGELQDLYDFSTISGMPLLDRLMAGTVSSHKILADTGMLPAEKDYDEWFSLARKETPYFVRVLTHYVVGGIYKSRKAAAIRLSRLDSPCINKICRELTNYLDTFEDCLKNNKTPFSYHYLPEVFFKNE